VDSLFIRKLLVWQFGWEGILLKSNEGIQRSTISSGYSRREVGKTFNVGLTVRMMVRAETQVGFSAPVLVYDHSIAQ